MSGYPGQDIDATKNYLQNHVTFDRQHPKDSVYDGLVPCDAPTCTTTMGALVNLHITPEKSAHRRKIDADFFATATGGYFVAKVVNNDSNRQRYEAFNLNWNDSVYIWAGLLPDGTKRIGVFHIAPNGEATMVAVARALSWCPPEPGQPRRTIAAFHIHGHPGCITNKIYSLQPRESHLAAGTSERSILKLASNPLIGSRSITAATMVHTTGLWFSCQMGCCEAQNTY